MYCLPEDSLKAFESAFSPSVAKAHMSASDGFSPVNDEVKKWYTKVGRQLRVTTCTNDHSLT